MATCHSFKYELENSPAEQSSCGSTRVLPCGCWAVRRVRLLGSAPAVSISEPIEQACRMHIVATAQLDVRHCVMYVLRP